MNRTGMVAGLVLMAGAVTGLFVMQRSAHAPESADPASMAVPMLLPPTAANAVQSEPVSGQTSTSAGPESAASGSSPVGGKAAPQESRQVSDSFRAWSTLTFLPDMADISGAAYVKNATGADDAGVARMMEAARNMARADRQFQAGAKAALCGKAIGSPEDLVAAMTGFDLDVEKNQEKIAEGALSELGPDLAGKVAALAAKQGPDSVSGTNWKEWVAEERRSIPEILYAFCKG